jgi:hypothetical protein
MLPSTQLLSYLFPRRRYALHSHTSRTPAHARTHNHTQTQTDTRTHPHTKHAGSRRAASSATWTTAARRSRHQRQAQRRRMLRPRRYRPPRARSQVMMMLMDFTVVCDAPQGCVFDLARALSARALVHSTDGLLATGGRGQVRLRKSAVRPGVSHHFPKILSRTTGLQGICCDKMCTCVWCRTTVVVCVLCVWMVRRVRRQVCAMPAEFRG